MKVRKVFKFATGEPIPKGAQYLNTVTQTKISDEVTNLSLRTHTEWRDCWLVWHYFLVEAEENV
jgi:hypothetical protein